MYKEEIETRIAIAEILVSLATHIALLDNDFSEEDEDIIAMLVGSLFEGEDCLFPDNLISEEEEEEILDIFQETIDDPIAMEDIVMLGKEESELGDILLEIAESFLQDKEVQSPDEIAFFENLKQDLS